MKRRISSHLELAVLQRQIDELLGVLSQPAAPVAAGWTPMVDILDDPGGLTVLVDLPGVSREQVEVVLQGRELHISGRKTTSGEQPAPRRYHRMERSFGAFAVEIPLPGPVDPPRSRATLRHGVLEVTLPRPEVHEPARQVVPVTEEEL